MKRSARTLDEARILKSELVADVARGEYRPRSSDTFAGYVADWRKTYAGRTSRGIRPETLADYGACLDRYALPALGRMRLAEIEAGDLRGFVARLADRGLSRNTIRLALAPVKLVFATALEDGKVRSNPATGIRVVAALRRQPRRRSPRPS
ncbi:MAG: hypothetical protein QOJ13_1945 [Gaiellales bacterium]|nr:hypothetical protein [Gaiellales bacterium]